MLMINAELKLCIQLARADHRYSFQNLFSLPLGPFCVIQVYQCPCTNFLFFQSFSTIYNVFFKRNSIFVGTVFASAFVFQAAFDSAVTSWYEAHNKGKLWKDVKLKLAETGEDDEDDDE